jgi:predicted regulator of Ras-like GTPase activity (Roadblock/LC7/MglB family)
LGRPAATVPAETSDDLARTDDAAAPPYDGGAPESPAPAGPAPAGEALPARTADRSRPRIQGLSTDTGELRRRQLAASAPQPSHRAERIDWEPFRDALRTRLRELAESVDGFEHALLCTVDGLPVAHHLVGDDEVTPLAAGTSALHRTGAEAGDEVDNVVVRLRDGSSVLIVSCGAEDSRLLLRLRARGAGLGLLLHVAQQTADATVATLASAGHTES